MSHARRFLVSVLGVASVVACGSTGIVLGDNPGHGSGGSASEGDASPHGSGGSEPQGSGGAAHPASGGTEHPASGGTANPGAGGTEHPASGGTNPGTGGAAQPATGGSAQGTGGSPDCSVIGCGAPPVCGESCSAPCGCCGCDWNDSLMVNGAAYQCKSDHGCYSPATYGYVGLATGAFRFAIVKRDELRNVCFRIVMGTTGAFGPFHVTTSNGLWVEAAHVIPLEDCESVSPAGPEGATVPMDITGHVLAGWDGKGACTLDLDAQMYLPNGPATTEKLKSPPIVIPDVACLPR